MEYPGGPLIDKLAKEGDQNRFKFAKPRIPGLDYSFSGLKTSFLYFLRDEMAKDQDFIEKNKADLCASLQKTIIDILVEKLLNAITITGINTIAVGGGVSANSGLRDRLRAEASKRKWKLFVPDIAFTTDNAAMIAITGYYKYLRNDFSSHEAIPLARFTF